MRIESLGVLLVILWVLLAMGICWVFLLDQRLRDKNEAGPSERA